MRDTAFTFALMKNIIIKGNIELMEKSTEVIDIEK